MQNVLPGTQVEAELHRAESVISAIFLPGGLVLSQVCAAIGIEQHTVQNWVKRKYVAPPIAKKYTKRQFCRIVIINILKDVLSMDAIVSLLSYINGHLDDESDDRVDDVDLYIYFTRLLACMGESFDEIDSGIEAVLQHYYEPFAGTRGRLAQVLKIMATAYASSVLKQRTLLHVSELEKTNSN